MLFNGDLAPGVRPEEAKDRLAHLLQVDDETLEGLFLGVTGVCVVKEGLDRAMAERYVAAFEAAGALCRLEADSSHKLAVVSHADVQPIADDGLMNESGPRRSAPHRRFRSVLSYVIGAAIGLLLLGGGIGLLWSRGMFRMPGFKEGQPNTQAEKPRPTTERPGRGSPGKAR